MREKGTEKIKDRERKEEKRAKKGSQYHQLHANKELLDSCSHSHPILNNIVT